MKESKKSGIGRAAWFVKALCLALALLLMAGVMLSCGKSGGDGETEKPGDESDRGSDVPGETETETETETGEEENENDMPSRLKINLLKEAWNVERDSLRFSWQVPLMGSDAMQKAYRIVVGTDSRALEQEKYVYDSDWVESPDSVSVVAPGLAGALKDGQGYAWSVAVKTRDGKTSAFSEPMPFVTASSRNTYPAVWTSVAKTGGDVIPPDSEDFTDYFLDATFVIQTSALGFIVRAKDPSNFYMWQFKLSGESVALYPHVFKDGKFVGNAAIATVSIPSSLGFGIGDEASARIEVRGERVITSLKDKNGAYQVIDDRDMSQYGLTEGTFGVRTGGQESGTVLSMSAYNRMQDGNPEGILYVSNFEIQGSPFDRCTVSDGKLQVPKAISTGSFFDASAIVVEAQTPSETVVPSADQFAFFRGHAAISARDLAYMSSAVLEITASSPESARQQVYTVYVNGTCLGVGPTREDKGQGNAKVLYVDAYGVAGLLRGGDNTVAVFCDAPSGKQLFVSLKLYDRDGKGKEILSTSDGQKWLTLAANSAFRPAQSLGTNYYKALAENIDATVFPLGFADEMFDETGWVSATSVKPLEASYTLAPAVTSPVRRIARIRETPSLTKTKTGYFIDLGQEIVGSFGLHINSQSEQEITLYFGERLNRDDGTVKYQMNTGNVYLENWKLKAGEQTIENFDLLCYRYVQIEGLDGTLSPEDVYGIELRVDFEDGDSTFVSDSNFLTRLWNLTKATAKYTTQSLYVDSQTRERTAYEGDAVINQLVVAAFSDDYTVSEYSISYLLTHRTWPAEYVLFMPIAARDLYLRTGDLSYIKGIYSQLKECQFTKNLDEELGLIRMDVKPTSTTDCVLVDWPMGERFGYDVDVEYNTAFNALAVESYRALSELAAACGQDADSRAFASYADTVKAGMIEELYDSSQGVFCDGMKKNGNLSAHFGQHATSYALYAGVYTDAAMADKMAASIERAGTMQCSVYGAFFLLEGLYRTGHGDIANALMLNVNPEDTHTWAYMLSSLEATLSAEAWNDVVKKNLTLSHPWGGAPAAAIVNGLFGLRPTKAGFAGADIRLQPGTIAFAGMTVPTLRGEVSVSYTKDSGSFAVSVSIPANMDVRVMVSDGAKVTGATLNGEAAGVQTEGGFAYVSVGGGNHEIVFTTAG